MNAKDASLLFNFAISRLDDEAKRRVIAEISLVADAVSKMIAVADALRLLAALASEAARQVGRSSITSKPFELMVTNECFSTLSDIALLEPGLGDNALN